MLFLDETGLMLQPLVRRTWAPKGKRPVLYCWDRHDRLSVIAGLTLSARRRRWRRVPENDEARREAGFFMVF